MSSDCPNHIYFANRANAYLEVKDYDQCISDCDQAIQIDQSFTKSYLRKTKALLAQSKTSEALKNVGLALEHDPENKEFIKLWSDLLKEVESDGKLPMDHPERKKFEDLLAWL